MRRWISFITGMAVGAVLLYLLLSYHLVRARDGLYLIAKLDAGLANAYVDVRRFSPADWAANPDLALALVRAGRRDLLGSAAVGALDQRLQDFFRRLDRHE